MKNVTANSVQYTGTIRQLLLRSDEFKSLLKGFEQWLRVFGFAESTVYYSPAYVRSFFFFLETQGLNLLSEITNYQIRCYMQELSQRPNFKTGRRLSQNYLLTNLNAIKLFARHILESKGIFLDSSYRCSRGQSAKRAWLIRKEIEQLYGACEYGKKGDMNRTILGVYYGLGLRRSEGVGLDVGDIQKHSGMALIRYAKFKQVRFVPIGEKIQYDIDNYKRRYRDPILKKKGRHSEKALLISVQGNRISGESLYSRIQNLATKAGVATPLSLHSLRHSIATHLMENGLSLENIAGFLGHKSLESTQIYTHLVHKRD